MQNFAKIPNSIFSHSLSAKAIFVFAYLISHSDRFQSAIVKLSTIAKSCNMDVKTAATALKELEQCKFITKQNRYNSRGYIANRYFIKNLCKDNKSWFKLPLEVFQTEIKSTDLVVYCYIQRCMSNGKREAFPSLSAIVKGTKISRGRVSKAVQYLRNYTFINRIKRRYKRTRAYRHNRYMQFKLAKRKACPQKEQASQQSITSLHLRKQYVNRKRRINANLQTVNNSSGGGGSGCP